MAAQSDSAPGDDPTDGAFGLSRDARHGRHRPEPSGGRRLPNRVLGPALTFGVVAIALMVGFVGLRGGQPPTELTADGAPTQARAQAVQTLLDQRHLAANDTVDRSLLRMHTASKSPTAALKRVVKPKPKPSPTRATARATRTAAPKPTKTIKPPTKAAVVRAVAGLDQVQMNNAAAIVKVGKEMGLPKFGLIIGVATAMQESALYNLASDVVPESMNYPHQGSGSDHDSVGLFQQRYTTGWGTVEQIMKPRYAAGAFFSALQRVDGWEQMALTRAAQTVQGSAFPDAYAKHEGNATEVVNALS